MRQAIADNLANVWAVVPVKRLSLAKQRLAFVLSKNERTELAHAMLIDVLTNLHKTQNIAGIAIVSGDPAVTKVAALCDARVVNDVQETGTNDAVLQGLKVLEAGPFGALVVPADIPFATADDFGAVIQALHRYPVVLAPASSDGGTNALAMRSPALVAPCFGEDSFVRHQAHARLQGLSCGIVRSGGLGQDIDCPGDLVTSIASKGFSVTSELLAELNVTGRLGVYALPVSVRCM